jgi:AraC-like DNA-binding protein
MLEKPFVEKPFVEKPFVDREEYLEAGRLTGDVDVVPPARAAFIERLRRHIAEGLELRETTVTTLARRMGMPPRSLQRTLSDLDTSLSDLLAQARKEAAIALLSTSDHDLHEIARRVGFVSIGSFFRAFRHWTGVTPRVYQRRTRAPQAAEPLGDPQPARPIDRM